MRKGWCAKQMASYADSHHTPHTRLGGVALRCVRRLIGRKDLGMAPASGSRHQTRVVGEWSKPRHFFTLALGDRLMARVSTFGGADAMVTVTAFAIVQ
ncbi:hypothetical protein GW17_00052495 [Ensete ventricosum]|nr:hypothetical protein GW17_00052495 [Ensete ventricosum]